MVVVGTHFDESTTFEALREVRGLLERTVSSPSLRRL